MSSSREPDSPESGGRRPAGARPAPKKKRSHGLFLRRQGTRDPSDDSTGTDAPPLPSAATDVRHPALPSSLETDELPLQPPVFSESPLQSPDLSSNEQSNESLPVSAIVSPIPVRAQSPRPFRAALAQGRLNAGTPPPSSATVHWASLRQAILSASPSRTASPAPSQASFGSARPPVATSNNRTAAKPPRFGRMGIKAVAQEARVMENHEARQFEDAIRQACWQCRFPVPGHSRQKWSMDNTGASLPTAMHGFSTSALHLPFVPSSASASNVSLPLAGNDPQLAYMGKRRGAAAATAAPTSQSAPASLQPLYHALAYYASLARQRPGEHWLMRLPEESDILYILAAPFASSDQTWAVVEQRVAVECFELIRKAWPVSHNEDTVERLLWCCEAARYAQSPLLERLLTFIRSTVIPTPSRQPFTPDLLRSCVWGLFNLQRCLPPDQNVSDVLAIVLRGKWVSIDVEAFQEEYAAKAVEKDIPAVIPLLAAEVIARGLAVDTQFCTWATSVLKDYWPPPVDDSSVIQSRMYSRAVLAFNHSALCLFRNRTDLKILHSPVRLMFLDVCQSKTLPYLRKHQWSDLDASKSLSAILLEMLNAGPSLERSQTQTMIREQWLSGPAGCEAFLAQLKDMLANDNIKSVVSKLSLLLEAGADFDACFTVGVPLLFDRLAIQLPDPDETLAGLLRRLSQKFPQVFFKPIFTCAGSAKDEVIASQLVSLTGVGRLAPEIWVSDAEMISVAILGDVGSGLGKGKGKEGSGLKWGRTRAGQCVIILELIQQVRRLCGDEIAGGKFRERMQSNVMRFVSDLEARIGILVNAKEQATLLPMSQRVLLCVLLYHMRRLTQSLKPAPWLSRLSSWACESYKGAQAHNVASLTSNPDDYGGSYSLEVDQAALDEITQTFERVLGIYMTCGSLVRDLKTSKPSSALSPLLVGKEPGLHVDGKIKDGFDVLLHRKEAILKAIPSSHSVPFLSLLVAVNGLLQAEHYRDLGLLIWNHCLDTPDPARIAPASFLFMQCGERFPDMVSEMINNDLTSESKMIQGTAIRRISYLLSRRHETLVQYHITDRTHRRPFKGIRQPISFVPTDIGSSQYVGPAEEDDGADVTVGVAKEVKKRLMEIGWVNEDSNTEDTNLERLPISMLPSQLLNRLGHGSGHTALLGGPPGPSSSGDPQKSLLRRKSSSSNFYSGVKRRTIFVSSVSSRLQILGLLAAQDDFLVAGQAQEVLSSAIRDDVSLVGRPILEVLSSQTEIDRPIAALRGLVYAQSALSPAFAHHVFNHITGFLKAVARDLSRIDAFQVLAMTLPLLSQLVPSVPDVALRDMRRNKVEVLMLPVGSLWFSDTAPAAPMFPRNMPTFTDHLDGIALDEVKMVNIRTVQNMIVLQLLQREPKDVYTFEKMVLPIIPPHRKSRGRLSLGSPSSSRALDYAWLSLSRSYLLVTAQIFQALSSSLSDRQKLSSLLDGVNRTVSAFSADLGVVTHAMICYLIAVSRFRRLVASQNGFDIFLPAIWDVYRTQQAHASIRVAVQTSMRFFYALHDETFIFQAVDSLASVIPPDGVEESVKAGQVLYDLFSSLDPSTPPRDEATGLQQLFTGPMEGQGSTSTQPELATSRVTGRGLSSFFDVMTTKGVLKRQLRNFPLDNIIRLCLTVIAHDPTSARAWRFLRVLRALAPKLYDHSTSARGVLRDGIDALGILLTKSVGVRPPPTEASGDMSARDVQEKRPLVTQADFNQVMILRREYLLLVRVFARAGATPSVASTAKTLLLVRAMLKDSAAAISAEVADFLGEYSNACLSRSASLNPKDLSLVLRDLSQLFQTYGDIVDFSGVLLAIEKLIGNGTMTFDPSLFANLIAEWCRPALVICDAAAAERRLWDLPLRRAVLSLLTTVVSSGGMDAFNLIDKKSANPSFLAGILLPLTLSMATHRKLSDGNLATRPDVRCSQWLRILSYVLPICQQLKAHAPTDSQRRLRKPSPGRSGEEETSSGRDPLRHRLSSAVFAFQILKIIIIQSGDDLAEASSRVWTSIAQALLDLLGDGSADFLFGRDRGGNRSPGLTPPGSTLSTPDNSFLAPDRVGSNTPSPGFPAPEASPRVVDFLFWSTMELVSSHRTPLMLYLRVFIQEKIHFLNRSAKLQERRSGQSPVRTSVFVRPRSSSVSPEVVASQPLRQSFLRASPASTPSRSPGPSYFQLSPHLSPTPLRPNAPRIVHLGPLPSPGVQASDASVGSQTLSSPSLAASTKRCIQNVRISLGYPALALDGDERGSQGDYVPWTRASALARIVEETMAFIDVEFKDELMAPMRTSTGSLYRQSPSPRKEPSSPKKDFTEKDEHEWVLERDGIP